MVAVIAGNGLGLDNSSLGRLGQSWGGQAGLGQAGMDQYVNVANGNLVLRDPGQSLVFDGTSLDALRVYNSRGQLAGDGGWSFGFDRNVGSLTGTLDTVGSTIVRTADDGSTLTYAYDAASGDYLSQGQAGTQDRLHWNAATNEWQWTDGASRTVETYDADGHLVALSQPQTGASFTFAWSNGRLASVVAGDGDTLSFDYDGSGRLTGLTLSEVPPGGSVAVVRQQVTYGYDALGRLSSVASNLASDTASDSSAYVTTYTYDGDSDRIASMTQGDGTTVSYAYESDGNGGFRVSRIVTGTGDDAQAVTLVYGDGTTTLTDALGHVWTYAFSSDDKLVSVSAPPNNGAASKTSYTYDADGHLASVTDANGGVTSYTYDGHGNLSSVEDPVGMTVVYTYDADDRMLSRTVYTVAAQGRQGDTGYVPPSGAQSTRYVYDGGDRLTYVIDPSGAVSKNSYITDASGNTLLSSTYAWRGATYGAAGTPTLADLAAWEAGSSAQAVLAEGSRTDYTYDVRGQVASRTVYDTVDAHGMGVLDAGTAMTRTVYDAAGRLLRSSTIRGADREVSESTSYAYDGLGRVVSATDASGHVTSTIYIDGGHVVEITDASGLTTTQVRNSAGLVVSTTRSTGQPPLAGETFYDAAGHAIASVDAQGKASYTFYDTAGHVTGTIGSDGKVTVTTYDAQGNKLSTVAYATSVDTTGWLDAHGPTSAMPGAVPVPPAAAGDKISLWIHDSNGQIVGTVSDNGSVVVTLRDGQGHATAVTTYGTPLDAPTVQALGLSPSIDSLLAAVVPGSADQRLLNIYDASGNLAASVDAAGYVTFNTYDEAGRQVGAMRTTAPLTADQLTALGTAPALQDVTAQAGSLAQAVQGLWIRNAHGDVVASVDASGAVVLYTYTGTTLSSTLSVSTNLTAAQLQAVAANPTYENLFVIGNLDVVTAGQDAKMSLYDGAGRVIATVSEYSQELFTYDTQGHLVGDVTYSVDLPTIVVDLSRSPSLAHLMDILSGAQASYRNIYDAQGRLAATIGTYDVDYFTYAPDGSWRQWTRYPNAKGQLDPANDSSSLDDVLNHINGLTGQPMELDYYDAAGHPLAVLASNGNVFMTLSDSQGHPTVKMSSDRGVSWQTAADGTPLSYADLLSSALPTFSHYVLLDASGNTLATVDTSPNSSWWSQDDLSVDVKTTQVDAERHITATFEYTWSTMSSTFATFTSHPSMDNLDAMRQGVTGRLLSFSYSDDTGHVVAERSGQQISYTSYDAQGRPLVQNYFIDNFDNTVGANDISGMPSLGGLSGLLANAEVARTDFYTYDGEGSTVYTASTEDVSVARYDNQGRMLGSGDYDVDPRSGFISQVPRDMTLDDVKLLIAKGRYALDDVKIYDASGKVSSYRNGQLEYTVDAGHRRLGETVTVALDDAALLDLMAAGDVSSLVAGFASKGITPTLQQIDLLDGDGHLLASVSAGSMEFMTYDAGGRQVSDVYFPHGADMDAAAALGDGLTVDQLRSMVPAGASAYSQVSIYDDAGHLLAQIDQSGSVTTMTYDAAGRLLSTVTHQSQLNQAQTLALSFAPSLDALNEELVLAGGAMVDQQVHDAEGRVAAHVDAQGNVTRFEYDAQGRVTTTIVYANALPQGFGVFPNLASLMEAVVPSADDRITLSIFDGAGRPAATIAPDGTLSVTTYDANGRAVSTVTYGTRLSRQQVASLGQDPALAQVLRLIGGRTTREVYDSAGQLVAEVDEQNRPDFIFHDGQGRVVETVDAQGAVTAYTYDAENNVVATVRYAQTVDISSWFDARTGALTPPTAAPSVAGSGQDRVVLSLRDISGRVVAQVDGAGTVTRFIYDGQGRVVATTVGATTLGADAIATLLSSPTPATLDVIWQPSVTDRTTRTVYDAAGHAAATIDSAGYVTVNTYDERGNLTQTRVYDTPLDGTALASLGDAPALDAVVAAVRPDNGDLVTRRFYDAAGNQVAAIDPAGYLTTWSYDAQAHTVTTTRHAVALANTSLTALTGNESAADLIVLLPSDANAQAIVDGYDAQGRQISDVDPTGATTRYGYDASGRQVSRSTTDSHGTYGSTVAYDAFGEVVSRADGVGDTTTSTWDENGRLVSTTDAGGYTTWFIYDQAGRVAYQIESRQGATASPDDLAAVTSFSYDTFGDLIQRRTAQDMALLAPYNGGQGLYPDGMTAADMTAWMATNLPPQDGDDVTRYTYDGAGRVASKTDGAGYITRYTYDAFGEVVSTSQQVSDAGAPATAANSDRTDYAYDARGQRVSVSQAAGTALQRSTVTAYDAFGRAISVTDPSGHVVNYGFDALGRQIVTSQIVDGGLSRSLTTWDAFGRVLTQTDAAGNVTTYAYDTKAGSTTITTPEGVAMTTVRDSLGDIVSVTDGAGNTTTYRYDAAGRLIETVDATGDVDDVTYQAGGTVSLSSGAHGDVQTTYDGQGRLLSRVVDPTGAQVATTYQYDGVGRVLVRQDEFGTTTYTYDGDGRVVAQVELTMSSMGGPGGPIGPGPSMVSRDRPIGPSGPGGPGGPGGSGGPPPGGVGSLDTGDVPINGVQQTTFSYDGEGHVLVTIQGMGADAQMTSYQYDALGRRIAQTQDPNGLALTTRYEYDAEDHVVRTVDPAGRATVSLYDEAGRLVYTIAPTGAATGTLGQVTAYGYDADGRLVATTTYGAPVDMASLGELKGATPADLLARGASLATQASDGNDRSSYIVRDTDGRVRFSLDPTGLVTETRYDSLGHVGETLQYTKALGLSGSQAAALRGGSANAAMVSGWLADAGIDAATAVVTYNWFDADGRVAYQATSVDMADGRAYAVTGTTYGADGQIATQSVYTVPLGDADVGVGSTVATITQALAARGADVGARVTSYVYDQAHRVIASTSPGGGTTYFVYGFGQDKPSAVINPMGDVTEYLYDFAGRVNIQHVYVQPISTDGWIVNGAPSSSFGMYSPQSTENDQVTLNVYDTAGRISNVVHYLQWNAEQGPTYEKDTYDYDGAGRLVDVVAYGVLHNLESGKSNWGDTSNIRVTRYFYDVSGNRIATLDAEGTLTVSGYDAAGQLLTSTTFATPVDPALRVKGTLDAIMPASSAADETQRFYRDELGRVIGSIDAGGYLTAYTYDTGNRILSTQRYGAVVPTGDREALASALASVEASPSHRVTHTYDDQGRLVSSTNEEGSVTLYAYDHAGNLVSTVENAGTDDVRTTSATYDLLGERVSQTDAMGVTTHYTYGVNGKVATQTDALGNTVWSIYDAADELAFVIRGEPADGKVNAKGDVLEMYYDGTGRLAQRTAYVTKIDIGPDFAPSFDSLVATVRNFPTPPWNAEADFDVEESWTYDGRGDIISYQGKNGYAASFDSFGEVLVRNEGDSWSSAQKIETDYTYDSMGRLVKQSAVADGSFTDSDGQSSPPINRIQSWTMDAFGNTVSYVDANGSTTRYAYDTLGHQIDKSQVVDGVVRDDASTYDAFGRVLSHTDGLGLTTTYSYDDVARSVVTVSPGGLTSTVWHDRDGHAIRLLDPTGNVTTYRYDLDGRLTDTQRPDGAHLISSYDAEGNLATSTDADGHTVSYTYDAAGRVLTQTVDPDGLKLVTAHFYSGAGLEVRTVDAAGAVTTYIHSVDGDITQSKSGVNPDGSALLTTTYSYDANGNLSSTVSQSAAGSVEVDEVHDSLGRLTQTTIGGIKHTYVYDENGNLRISNDGYADTYYAYNEANQLIWKAEPAAEAGGDIQNRVTGYRYDADGHLVATTEYATTIPDSHLQDLRQGNNVAQGEHNSGVSAAQAIADLTVAPADGDRSSYQVYDSLGRLAYRIDENGAVTETRYDTLGRVVETLAYAVGLNVPADLAAQLAVGKVSGTQIASLLAQSNVSDADARISRTYYDSMGRVAFTVAEGTAADGVIAVVTEIQYDADGNVTAKLEHDAPLGASDIASATTASLQAWAASSPSAQGARTVYDAAGRVIFLVDQSGYVQKFDHDGDGRVTTTTSYANPITTSVWTGAAVSAAVAATNPDATDARGNVNQYDSLGNIVATYVLGDSVPTATYTYDSLGNRVSYTNRDGQTWTYTYQGKVLASQTGPRDSFAFDVSQGAPGTVTGSVTTSYNYDALGQLLGVTVRSPSGDRTETDSTTDRTGRITSTSKYDSSGAGYRTQAFYDGQGHQVATTDADGHMSFKVYDRLGRLAYDVDAEGGVTGYTYDTYGEVVATTRYAHAVDGTALADTGQAIDLATLQAHLVTGADDRTIRTVYDGFGRKIAVIQPTVSYMQADGSVATSQPVTRYTYDVHGRQTSQSTLVEGTDGQPGAVWATSYTWYDASGRKTMSVDPMGYVSTWTYDGFGEVTQSIDYATPIATQGLQPGGTEPTVPAVSDTDRVTQDTYDSRGRKASESVLRDYIDDNGQATRGFVTTTYGYDNEDRVTTITADGRTVTTTYDTRGNIASVTAPPEQVLVSNWRDLLSANPGWDLSNPGLYVSASQVMTFTYDAFGNRLTQTQSSTAGGPVQSTWYRYDSLGRLTASDSPLDASTPAWTRDAVRYTYDANGNVTSKVSTLSLDPSGSPVTVTTSYTYDAAGRQTSSVTTRSNAASPDAATTTTYDIFGEVTGTGNGLVAKGASTYDAAGRVTTAVDSKTGVLHTYSYDLAGRMVQDASHATGGGLIYTRYALDLDGRIVSRLAPSTTSATGEAATALQATYDRWGNVLTSTDANGNTTTYTYDERNQVTSTSGPAVTVLDEHGNASTSMPVKRNGYDIDGKLVTATDENGNVTRTVYDAAGQTVDVIDGAGSHTLAAYDVLGRQVAAQTGTAGDGTLHITYTDVDMQGRTVGEGDFLTSSDGTRLVATQRQVYVLDQAGNRVAVYDGLGSGFIQAGDQKDADLHATFYVYDSQGHVIESQTGAQRAATLANGSALPPVLSPPRNLDFQAGGLAWTPEADAAPGWNFSNGQAVYNGVRQDNIGSDLINDDAVPVTPGMTINAWADVQSVGDHGGANAEIAWYAADGTFIGFSKGNIQTTEEGRGTSRVSGVAPDGAAFARIAVNATNYSYANQTNTVYGVGWDYQIPDQQLSPGLDGSIFVNLPPGSFSLQPSNPDFENGDSGWDKAAGWSIEQVQNTANGSWVGAYRGSGVSTMVNQDRVPVVPGQKITVKGRISLNHLNGGDSAGALLILWYDANGNQIRYNSSNVIYDAESGKFQDASVTDVAPPGAAYAAVGLSGNGNGAGIAVFDAISWDYRYIPTLTPRAVENAYTYDRDGNLVGQTNADGDTESWVRDNYGRVTDHTDLSGATYHYTYDSYSGLQTGETDNWASQSLKNISTPGYVTPPVGSGNTETRTYNAAGQVTSISYADGSTYSYAYDANGNQVRQESTTLDGNGLAVHTVTSSTYDSHNRLTQVTADDGRQVMTETYDYDAAGNRRRIVASVTVNGAQISSTTSWYTYDGANRVAVSDGDLVGGTIVVAGRNTSYALSYDAAGNAAVRLTRSGTETMLQRSQYDGRGQLVLAYYAVDMTSGESRGVAETRTYDNQGNVVTDNQYYALGSRTSPHTNPKTDPDSPYYIGDDGGNDPGVDIGGQLSTATITRYDTYGRVLEEQTFGHDSNWNGEGGATSPGDLPSAGATSYGGMTLQSAVLYQGPGGAAAYDAMGNVVFYQYQNNDNRLDQYTVTYLKKEGYLESQTSGQNVSNLANVRPATDESYYNARGERIAIAQHTQYAFGTVADTVRVFAYDGNGQILERRDGSANGSQLDQGSDPTTRTQHYVYVDGQQVAHYDEKNALDVLSEVTAFSSGNGTGDYVVQQGDTLKSIAQAVYGNASLWYIVAQANALGSDADLALGLSLTIPAVTTSKNDSTTFKPYNPSEIQGSTTPDLPVIAPPPPPPKHHCNVIAAVVVIAVAVVASFVVGPEVALALNSALAGVAAGAAAASAASQLAGDALGTHHGFSLGDVFTSAATAVVTFGVGQYLGGGGEAASAASDSGFTFGESALQSGVGYVTQDVAAKLVGEPGHFSWAGLVSTSLAGGAASLVGPTQTQVQAGELGGSFWRVGAASLVEDTVQRETSLALGDSHVPSIEQIGERAAGSALGAFLAQGLPRTEASSLDKGLPRTGASSNYGEIDADSDLSNGYSGQASLFGMYGNGPVNPTDGDVYPLLGPVTPGYESLFSRSTTTVPYSDMPVPTLAAVTSSANVPGTIAESYDPQWAAYTDSSHGASAFDQASFRSVGDTVFAEAQQARAAQDGAYRRSAEAQMTQNAFTPVAPTVFSRLYDSAVEYGNSQTDLDRQMNPLSTALGTRQWPARILAGIGNVVASVEGVQNSWDGGLDQGNNPFTQQGRMGVENQDTRLNFAANVITLGLGGVDGVAVAVESRTPEETLLSGGPELVGNVDSWLADQAEQAEQGRLVNLSVEANGGIPNGGEVAGAQRVALPQSGEIATDVVLGDGPVNVPSAAVSESTLPPAYYTECFIAGTPIHTEAGLKPIEQVVVGDKVAARNEYTGETSWRLVKQLFSIEDKIIVDVALRSKAGDIETISATNEHPFFVHDARWCAAQDLSVGDQVVLLGGDVAEVVAVALKSERQNAYNFEVADVHTYFVGSMGVWVHNSSSINWADYQADATRRAASLGDQQFPTQADALAEALARHGIDPSTVEFTEVYGKNPNLTGPQGQPWEKVSGLNSDGDVVKFDHHSNGHFFRDSNDFELPHYHGPNGEHLSY